MPRKRRVPKKRAPLPAGLQQISLSERALWACSGPLLAADMTEPVDGYVCWPDLPAFLAFYADVRGELFAARPQLAPASVTEQCVEAWMRGADPAITRDRLRARCAADDPRRRLLAETKRHS